MSFVPATADADLWTVLGVLLFTAGAMYWTEHRSRTRANAVDANGNGAEAHVDEGAPPPAGEDGQL